jgi:AcrR family transcriptional regulator
MGSKDKVAAMNDEVPLRADAARNRERILEAAEALFVERGAEVSLDDIARRAQVGIGTLYRRFPTREALLAAASDERLMALVAASRARHAAPDPAGSLRAFLRDLVKHASHYRGLAASLGAVLQSGTPGCHASREEGQRLLRDAQRARAMRKDVSLEDLLCVVTAVSLALEQEGTKTPRLARLVDLFLDGVWLRKET